MRDRSGTDKRPVLPPDPGGAPREHALESFDTGTPRSDVWPAPARTSIEPPPIASRPSIEPPPLASPGRSFSLERALWAIASLSHAERGRESDEGLVRAFVDALALVAPDALVFARLLEPTQGEGGSTLGFAYANGKLIESRREVLELSESGAASFGVTEESARAAGVKLVRVQGAYFLSGEGTAASPLVDVPLVDAGTLVGIVSIEEAHPGSARGSKTIAATLAALLGATLRNARLERAALFFRDYLAQTLEHASAPIFVLDRSRTIRSANRAALSLLRAPKSDVLGKDFLSMLGDGQRDVAFAALAQAFAGRATNALELDVLRLEGDHARVAWNVAPIYDPEGDASAAVVIGRDLTEVHHLEEQILHTDKLATLGQLAAGIVHELNNPLTSITVYGEYLHAKAARSGAEPGDVEKLRRIVESASRMSRFTRDLVTYARPSNEEETALSIREVALEGIRFCEHLMSECNVTLTTDFDADLTPISGVRGQLHQVFVNLVTNASHALAPRGGGHVHVEAHRATSPRGEDEIVVLVRDDGPGIPAEHLTRIFDPFFSTKAEGVGTGLGLSIVRKIVKAHRGSIDVTTRHGESQSGTTFELRFPSI
ncbi:MAG: ATP-binding protein [Sandaracinus sp.]